MKVYLAGRYQEREKLVQYAIALGLAEIEVTSRWLEETHQPNTQLTDVPDLELVKYAVWDLQDVDSADILVQICDEPNTRGGAHVEFGFALGAGKKIVVVGPEHNIFHRLPSVYKFDTWLEAEKFLIETAVEEDLRHQST